jgi:hypothetical protein
MQEALFSHAEARDAIKASSHPHSTVFPAKDRIRHFDLTEA